MTQTTNDEDITILRICMALHCEDPALKKDNEYYEKCSAALERLIKNLEEWEALWQNLKTNKQ